MKLLVKNTFTALIVLLLITACSNNDSNVEIPTTLLIGHRASGAGVKSGFIENTLTAVKESLKYADGVEVDIQLSKDSTLWIYHDDLLNYNCEGDSSLSNLMGNCIPSLSDNVISTIRICREGVTDRIYRLSELFELYESYPDKYISLDVKGYFNESCIAANNVDGNYLNVVAEEIYQFMEGYDMADRVFVETNYTYLFDRLKEKDLKIQCHLLGYKDLNEKTERCLENDWQGISFNMNDSSLTAENVKALKDAQLALQLWTVNSEDDFRAALRAKPAAIQVSSIELLKTIQTKGIQTFY